MTESNDDAIRDLVRRAYAAEKKPRNLDVADDLREMLTRARRVEKPTVDAGLARTSVAYAAEGTRIAPAAFDISGTRTITLSPQTGFVKGLPPGVIIATTRYGGWIMPPARADTSCSGAMRTTFTLASVWTI